MKSLPFDRLLEIAKVKARLRQLEGEDRGNVEETTRLQTPELMAQTALIEGNVADSDAVAGLESYLLNQVATGQNVMELSPTESFNRSFKKYSAVLRLSVWWHTIQLQVLQAGRKLIGGQWQTMAMPSAYALVLGLLLLVVFNLGVAPNAIISAHLGGFPPVQLAGTEMGIQSAQPQPPAQAGSPIKTQYGVGNLGATTAAYERGGTFSAEDHLLAGCAYLQLGQADRAVTALSLAAAIGREHASSLQDESNYYLVFAHLGAGQAEMAAQLLEEIRQDADFAYRKKEIQLDYLYVKIKVLSLLP
jgi:hypothetical protein